MAGDPKTVHEGEDAKEWELEFTCSSSLTDVGGRLDVHPERREREFARYIESRFGAALSPRRHIWAVFFGTGCLIWYRREPLCERGLVLRRIEAAGRADVTRSSSFRYKSQFYTSLSTDRKTSPYMAEQYDSFVDCDPQERRARGRVQVFHTDPYTVIIITNG